MRHTHHQFRPQITDNGFFRNEQKGEKVAQRNGCGATPAETIPGTPGGAISRGRAPDTPAGPKAKCRDQIICFYGAHARDSTPNCFAPCRFSRADLFAGVPSRNFVHFMHPE